MDRRTFLKSVGITAAGTAVATSSSSAADFSTAPSSSRMPPQFLSGRNGNRPSIQSSDLTPWVPSSTQPWGVHTINHLYRRAGFGATLAEITAAAAMKPGDVVDALLNDTLLTQPTVPPVPSYADSTNAPPSWLHVAPIVYNDPIKEMNDFAYANMKIRSHWAVQMNQPNTMLREKLTLFWTNHFVVEAKKVYYPQSMYSYLTYFRNNAWGNFKKMVSDVTTMPAMLIYLDGILNQGYAPNENYAREVQELFTMGVLDKNGNANYTQADVEAIAAALTGWTVDGSADPPNVLPPLYNPSFHNSSFQKIYDGVNRQYNLTASGASMDMDLFDHIFQQRGDQIAWFICSELYQFFVYHEITAEVEQTIIQPLADTFKLNWSVKDVLSQLLKSSHFFDEANIGAEIKSPYDHLIGLLRTFNIQIEELAGGTLYYYAAGGSQILLDPPNVKGWPGNHAWISTTTLPYRNTDIETQLMILGTLAAVGADGYGNNHLPVTLSDAMITTWGSQFTNYNGTFDDLLAEMATYLCAQTPSATALGYIKSKLPPNTYEWASLTPSEKVTGLRLIANSIMLLADFQLC
jgi:uncharacterized protein (DUF1800 family)